MKIGSGTGTDTLTGTKIGLWKMSNITNESHLARDLVRKDLSNLLHYGITNKKPLQQSWKGRVLHGKEEGEIQVLTAWRIGNSCALSCGHTFYALSYEDRALKSLLASYSVLKSRSP